MSTRAFLMPINLGCLVSKKKAANRAADPEKIDKSANRVILGKNLTVSSKNPVSL